MNNIIYADCLNYMKTLPNNSIDLIYLDPPFFTQRTQKGILRNEEKIVEFQDSWKDIDEYLNYIKVRLIEMKRILKDTGSIFLHCDKTASHYLRVLLDNVFGMNNFQSEIIWSYKRWSNSKKGLLNSHQNIYFYSKSAKFKFNTIYTEYSATTNIDQILQQRKRDKNGKCVYKTDENGNVVTENEKKGVPLSDVWEIPFLNPKAKERVGYPTQKPILLLEKIIQIATDEGDVVLDPFCGSGTTLVASKLLNRKYIGIDFSKDAIAIAENRVNNPIKTESELLNSGIEKYRNKSEKELEILSSIGAIPVQRNSGIDGFILNKEKKERIAVKIQKETEELNEAKKKLIVAASSKGCNYKVLIKTNDDVVQEDLFGNCMEDDGVLVIGTYTDMLNKLIYEK
ncbi:MAG: site-specific DNA-methyltransferase [Clostridia bacterium]|nr:site-specific DNA-methyltransferase [Clostridia bacterium]